MEKRQQGSIFISYRTDDTGHAASRLFEDLTELYGSEQVFIDHKKIAGGEAWQKRLEAAASQAAVMFVLIGSGWLKAQNAVTGDRRLNEPEDWVRREVQTALDAELPVVPVLVDNARPLSPADLRTVPEIVRLAEKQAVPLRRNDWDTDVAMLQRLLLSRGIAPLGAAGCANAERRLTSDGSIRSLGLGRLAPPNVSPHFRDRNWERQRITEHLQRGRPCALVAIGGFGKTTIAAQSPPTARLAMTPMLCGSALRAHRMPPCHKNGSQTRLGTACELHQVSNRDTRC